MSLAGIEGEEAALRRLFAGEELARLDLASGYFNLTAAYAKLLLARIAAGRLSLNVLAAAPRVPSPQSSD